MLKFIKQSDHEEKELFFEKIIKMKIIKHKNIKKNETKIDENRIK